MSPKPFYLNRVEIGPAKSWQEIADRYMAGWTAADLSREGAEGPQSFTLDIGDPASPSRSKPDFRSRKQAAEGEVP